MPRSKAQSSVSRFSAILVAVFLAIAFCMVPAQNNRARLPTAADIIQFLTKTIDWYRQTQVEQQIVNEPTDLTFAEDNRRTAEQIVRQAFEFARQAEQLIAKQPGQSQSQGSSSLTQYQELFQAAANTDQQIQQTQAELQALEKKRQLASGRKRRELQSQIAELQSELGLMQARRDTLHTMLDFVNEAASGMGASGLRGQIDELARSVPVYLTEPSSGKGNDQSAVEQSVAKNAAMNRQPSAGIWGLTAELFRLSRKKRVLKQEIAWTDALAQSSNQLRAPLAASLKQMIDSGDQLAVKADTSDPAALAEEKHRLDALTAQFKQISAALLPLSKQGILLDLYKRNLTNWRNAVKAEYLDALESLLLRLLILAAIVGFIFAVGELWRRTIFRYVQDVRRRYQFLLLRRIVLWIAVIVVLIFTFSTEMGSIATFAGLITAGLAVAMQSVIVSIVGYFLLIGKYGIRVGDRVQVSGVSGEVVDIGLVRFHLMELALKGTDFQPTGRVVAFSNSIVFQSTPGLFKQIPGTDFVWHEIKLTFAPESGYHVVRQHVNKAINAAFADYREQLERQRRQMEMTLSSISGIELKPKAHVQFAPSGIEVVIRYPVVLQHAAEIDDRVMSELLATVEREPKLKLVGSEVPTATLAA